jgi:hypothetical protein
MTTARLHGGREGRAKTFATETPRGWLAKHDKPTAAREAQTAKAECGENVTAPRGLPTQPFH